MFQLKYNGGFLDLGVDQKLEFQRENPMFILNDFYKEYSTPIVIKYSEKNVALLGGLFFDSFNHQPIKVDCELWQYGSVYSIVTLVVDKADPNRRNAGKGDVNGYLLAGLSRLFYKIKFRFLNTLQFGGPRVFNFTTDNPHDGSNGYFQHFFATANNTFDYIIAPVRNDVFNGSVENSSGWMNDWMWQRLSNSITVPIYGTTAWTTLNDETNPQYFSWHENKSAVVFPRFKYIFTQIFIENGYTLDTSELNGTNWEEIFLLSLYPIYFYNSIFWQIYDSLSSTGSLTQPFANSITIDLANCISPEITCASFLLAICKKYGWTILPIGGDSYKIVVLKNVKSLPKMDITKFVSDSVQADFSIGGRIQAFTNTFPNSEEFSTGKTPAPDDGKYIETPVYNSDSLPDLTKINAFNLSTYDNSRIFVYDENKYYKIGLLTSTVTVWNNTRVWIPDVDNVYNYQPPNNTESIDSEVTTLPVYWTQYRTDYTTNVLYYGFFPICKQSRLQNWGIRTMQFVGNVTESYIEAVRLTGGSYTGPLTTILAEGTDAYTSVKTPGTFQYPLLSCCRSNGVTDILPWSNTYTHPNPADGKDYGLISYWFQNWLDTIGLTNVYEQNIYLPIDILKRITFNTIFTIDNIPYLIQSYTEPIPYKGFILAKMVRLIMDKTEASVTLSSNVYLKIYWENLETASDFIQSFPYRQPSSTVWGTHIPIPIPYLYKITGSQQGDLIVKAYSDPFERNLIPELNLTILLRIDTTDPSGNIIDISQFSDFAPTQDILLKTGNFHARIYLKDGTANIRTATLFNDLLIEPSTKNKLPLAYFYDTQVPHIEAGFGIFDYPFNYFIPQPIPPSSNGKCIKTGVFVAPSQFAGAPIISGDYFTFAGADTKNIVQNISLRYSPNYIIIP